ncbi:uncharacterized protein A4U43_C02F13710 [Asparagus officinalis]|uniref:Uncharacterized protein n=1 Tax=Asparagus officinalis TaxID=4686 RepID=A0A5P1FN46_ASPOF|nr:uncharacterized protein A4U43_C02F13710 [Asparagus officinalis]
MQGEMTMIAGGELSEACGWNVLGLINFSIVGEGELSECVLGLQRVGSDWGCRRCRGGLIEGKAMIGWQPKSRLWASGDQEHCGCCLSGRGHVVEIANEVGTTSGGVGRSEGVYAERAEASSRIRFSLAVWV